MGFCRYFYGRTKLVFCECWIARFFSFAFLSLQGDIERCFRFEKIENRQTKKTWLRKFFVLARDFFHSRAITEKKSRVFCRKTEPQFLLFRCVFCERFLLR
ncbi:DUF1661 domain-containing protein [Porphyromonas gingivalis]|uniref:DUF1661 domain-containing protein n=1 Tax=Porphyromonas gingivalis TaxID=837 RepID=UPI0035280D95